MSTKINLKSLSNIPSKPPIFIHSLFRSGSTYIFDVFRRLKSEFFCFQEPLHEQTLFANNNPSSLLTNYGREHALHLRHSLMFGDYFKELEFLWPIWQNKIKELSIYDAYFSTDTESVGIAFWESLIVAAPGRPVFQECRTSGRIRVIKNHLGGSHIYLWRNPWDQYWSYKVTPYFDITNQLILNARHAPKPIKLMVSELKLDCFTGESISDAFTFYNSNLLASEERYLCFYMLWCLGLQEGMKYADLLLNIDHLSASNEYKKEIVAMLEDIGVSGIDLSDCKIPQAIYSETEQAFFIKQEEKVHHWLIEGGWSQSQINEIQELRNKYKPNLINKSFKNRELINLVDQASRARDLTIRYETDQAISLALNKESEAKAKESEAKAKESEAKAKAIYNSRSWRITAPIRFVSSQVRLMISHGFKSRIKALARKLPQLFLIFINKYPMCKRCLTYFARRLKILDYCKLICYGKKTSILISKVKKINRLTPQSQKVYNDLSKAIKFQDKVG